MTSFDGAQAIVHAGDAKPSDFWLFCGICGWETSSFYREMHQEGLWRIVSSDGGTILEELNRQRCEEEELAADEVCDVDSDSRNAGIHTWEMLMEMIGRGDEALQSDDSFGDLMLKEWATGALSFTLDEKQSTSSMIPDWPQDFDAPSSLDESNTDFDVSEYDPALSMTSPGINLLQKESKPKDNIVGTLIRASAASRSPFLLSDQGYHKSLVLILRDDDESTEGVILNHVTDRSYPLVLGGDHIIEMPLRYGGPIQEHVGDMLPLTFLHTNKPLAEAGMGSFVTHGIFRCTEEDVINAISVGLANSDEFMAIQGLSVWAKIKDAGRVEGGVIGDIKEGFFEPVSQISIVSIIWNTLIQQKKLSQSTLEKNISLLNKAWHDARSDKAVSDFNEEDRILVFGSEKDVTRLADEALCQWIQLFLLDGTTS
jgi:putative AlgH/UPF0301 family transcriptional regulator